MFRYLLLIISYFLIITPVAAQWYYGSGEAVNLEDRIKFQPDNTTIQASNGVLYTTDSNGVTVKVDKDLEADFLLNRSFEKSHSGSPALSWTLSGATGTVSTSSPIDGSQLLSLSLSGTLSLSQEITATQYHPNVVSFSLWVKSSITDIQLCSTLATVEQECVSYDGSNQWKKLQVLVTAPSSGAMGLKLKTISTTSGTILVDNGEFSSNPLKFGNRPDAVFLGSVAWSVTSGCIWAFSGTTYATATTAACDDNPRIIKGNYNSTNGSAGNPDGQVPQIKLSYIPQGVLKCRAIGSFYANFTNINQWRFSDGTDSSVSSVTYYGQFPEITGEIYYSKAQVNKTIQVQASVSPGGVGNIYVHNEVREFEISCYSIPDKINNQILTANDVVSSETINWQFKPSAITDCGGADAIGTYNTYSKAASSHSFSLCATPPATLPNNNDGFFMQSLSYVDLGTCGGTGISKVDICIGKGLKGFEVLGYELPNKGGEKIDTDQYLYGTNNKYGLYKNYNEKTGVLTLDSGSSVSSLINSSAFLKMSAPLSSVGNAYFHFTASKNPVISALDAVPRIDYSWENRFDLIIAGSSETVPCTSNPCTIYGDNQGIALAANRSTTGRYTVTLDPSKIASYPFVEISATVDSHSCSARMTADHIVGILCDRPAPTNSDAAFKLTITRRSDYRSRGDAAAIIAQPTCYVKQIETQNTGGGTGTAFTWNTRKLNTTSGSCSFLSLSLNQVTLDSGTYKIYASAPCFGCDQNRLKWYNVTDSSDVILGKSGISYDYSPDYYWTPDLSGQFTISSSKTFELRHYFKTLGASAPSYTFGFPVNVNGYTETYTEIAITKVK